MQESILSSISKKLFSARYLITIAITFTYCAIVLISVLTYIKVIAQVPEKMESFVTGIIVGFSGQAMFVIKAYFDRRDREPQENQVTK